MGKQESTLGIQYDKEKQTNEWYTEVINKGELIEYSDVSGCYIIKPKAWHIWEQIMGFINNRIKARGVKNAAFPLFIPEHLLIKEKEHVEGLAPEVAWVTHGGSTKLQERLAVRPTSETIMYDAYAKWIRSHNDLPLKLNQWCSVVRWEFKHPQPFLRAREFHWQEGHTAFATQKEAVAETKDILLNVYKAVYEELLAIPVLAGFKSEQEKFAGAIHTCSVEAFLPIGKAIQGGTTHYLGQNFSKPFGIQFTDKDQKKKYVHQNSWGLSTRSIGIMVMMHSDSHGLVIPPRVAEHKLIIIPIFRKGNKQKVVGFARKLLKELKSLSPLLDEREQYSVGWKFNEAELAGIPIRIELGEKELSSNKLTIMRRDTLKKHRVPVSGLSQRLTRMLVAMHKDMFKKAQEFMEASVVVEYRNLSRIAKHVGAGKLVKTVFDGARETDEIIKTKTGGKAIVIPFDESPKKGARCPFTGNPAKHVVYVARSV